MPPQFGRKGYLAHVLLGFDGRRSRRGPARMMKCSRFSGARHHHVKIDACPDQKEIGKPAARPCARTRKPIDLRPIEHTSNGRCLRTRMGAQVRRGRFPMAWIIGRTALGRRHHERIDRGAERRKRRWCRRGGRDFKPLPASCAEQRVPAIQFVTVVAEDHHVQCPPNLAFARPIPARS